MNRNKLLSVRVRPQELEKLRTVASAMGIRPSELIRNWIAAAWLNATNSPAPTPHPAETSRT